MKRHLNPIITGMVVLLASCSKNGDQPAPRASAPVDILIGTTATRSDPTPDKGHAHESHIAELDLLVFDDNGHSYRRQAYKLDDTNRFRATLLETEQEVTCYLLANCQSLLDEWKDTEDHVGKGWPAVQSMLQDLDPARLTGDPRPVPLPMWAVTEGTVSSTSTNTWGPVRMLRSVASVDLYVEKNEDTSLFELTDLYLWYAPDRGYLAPVPDDGAQGGLRYASPPEMTTSLTADLHATVVETITVMREDTQYDCDAIAFQIYTYDNDVTDETVTPARRFSRAVLGGYYDQPDDPAPRVKSYYPLDFAYSDGRFRPLIRNWKYEFLVTAVNGPGYGSPEEAAENYPIDINTEVIDWNMEGIYIGVTGRYYVSLERRYARLRRDAGSTDRIGITYTILDQVPGTAFGLSFRDDSNGPQQPVAGGVANDRFEATLDHDTENQSATLTVRALQDFSRDHSTDLIVMKFRDLIFEIAVKQYDTGYGDWESGGEQDEALERGKN